VDNQIPPARVGTDPAFRGRLEESPLPEILRRIFLEQRKGTLNLSRGDEVRRLFFEKGELRTATSSRETQRIGSFLKRRGRITEEDLSWALGEIARQSGSRLGKTLVSEGLLPKAVIDAEMKRLVEEIVFSAFQWESGEYSFETSTEVLDPDIALSLSTAAIIVEGIRRLPETPLFRERLGDGHRVLRLARDPMSRYQYLPLTPQEAYVLSRIDGVLDVDSLLSITGGTKSVASKVVYALLSCGLVEWKTDGGPKRETKGTPATLNVEVADQPIVPSPEHAGLVHTTWRRIDWLTYYDLLSIPRAASAEDVRRAYFERSRLFHPDLAHRADLAGLDRELSAVFERLKVAHDTLADPAARAEYDRTLDDAPAVVFTEEAAADPKARRQLAQKNFDRAMQLIEEKDYYSAVELLREAVRFAPDRAEYRFRLGEVELKNEKWIDRGIENLREATRLAPTRGEFLRTTARALAAHGRQADAEMYAKRANDVDPGPESAELVAEICKPAAQPRRIRETTGGAPRPGFLGRILRKRE
jgi:curved DNA-binding protein CbpA